MFRNSRKSFVSKSNNIYKQLLQTEIELTANIDDQINTIVQSSSSSSSRIHVINHNWSATKQHLHPQSVAEMSRHSVLSGDRIRQCETSSGFRRKDTDQYL